MLAKNTCQTYIKCIFHFWVNGNIKEKGIKKTKQQQQLTKCRRGKIKFYILFSAVAAITFSKIHSQTLNLTAYRGSLLASFSAIAVALIASLGQFFFLRYRFCCTHTLFFLSMFCVRLDVPFAKRFQFSFDCINMLLTILTVALSIWLLWKGAKPIVVSEVQGEVSSFIEGGQN